MTARSSSVSSTSPAFATSPPSSISCRVRSRRFTTQSRTSSRVFLASSRWRAAPARRSATSTCRRASRRASPAFAKEGRASSAPFLLPDHVGSLAGRKQSACQLLYRQTVGAGRDDQLAKLPKLALLKRSCLVVERLQLRIIIPWCTHAAAPSRDIVASHLSTLPISGNGVELRGTNAFRKR